MAPTLAGLLGLHHVAYAVSDLDGALAHWTGLLGGHLELRRELADQGVEAATIEVPGSPLIELVAPLGADLGVARFLERRGAGLHHVAWEVASVEQSIAALVASGVEMIDAEGRPGLHDTLVAFVHPRSMGGVLTELVEAHSP